VETVIRLVEAGSPKVKPCAIATKHAKSTPEVLIVREEIAIFNSQDQRYIKIKKRQGGSRERTREIVDGPFKKDN